MKYGNIMSRVKIFLVDFKMCSLYVLKFLLKAVNTKGEKKDADIKACPKYLLLNLLLNKCVGFSWLR